MDREFRNLQSCRNKTRITLSAIGFAVCCARRMEGYCMNELSLSPAESLLAQFGKLRAGCILADPPWQFQNKTGKVAPEHRRLSRYATLTMAEIKSLPVADCVADRAHLYLWVPNALLPDGLEVMRAWGFEYKSNLIWYKTRKDGGPDGRGVGFYYRNVTEILLFGVRGKNVRTLSPGRTQVNLITARKREHSRKPDEFYKLIEDCSWGPFLELFARGSRSNWHCWGDQAASYAPTWSTYRNHSASGSTVTSST